MDIRVFCICKEDYDPRREYPFVIADLLNLAGVDENDTVHLGMKGTQKRRLRDHASIREFLKLPGLSITSLDSRLFKESQACGALVV